MSGDKDARSLEFSILMDDSAGSSGLKAEHGLSFWIAVDGMRVLFDTGLSSAFWQNARSLGIDPSDAEAVVISHGHCDHTGGLLEALSLCSRAEFFLHPSAVAQRFARSDDGKVRSIGMPRPTAERITGMTHRIRWTHSVTPLCPAVFATGEVPRLVKPEASTARFFLDERCTSADGFADDQALVVNTSEGAIVFLGCSHSGVENTLALAARRSSSGKLRAVVGGMHLLDTSDDSIALLSDRLARHPLEIICPCHCTGARATEHLKGRFPEAFRQGHVGTVLRIGTDKA